jgi:hypothetical protein
VNFFLENEKIALPWAQPCIIGKAGIKNNKIIEHNRNLMAIKRSWN